ncbi:hypothetical protein [Halosegnis marinus]|uniref:hypothetical protein n=1 Tax=Halosegnis marinus TaxID=3034023 RepID=UPI003610295E
MRRRHLLSTAAAAAAAGLAGCSSLPGTGSSGERARYDSWVRDDDDGDVAAVTLDLSTYRELGETGTATATETPAADPETDDPLLLIPAAYLLGGALAVGFGVRYGLSDTIESDGGAEYAHVVDGAIVLEGSSTPTCSPRPSRTMPARPSSPTRGTNCSARAG